MDGLESHSGGQSLLAQLGHAATGRTRTEYRQPNRRGSPARGPARAGADYRRVAAPAARIAPVALRRRQARLGGWHRLQRLLLPRRQPLLRTVAAGLVT